MPRVYLDHRGSASREATPRHGVPVLVAAQGRDHERPAARDVTSSSTPGEVVMGIGMRTSTLRSPPLLNMPGCGASPVDRANWVRSISRASREADVLVDGDTRERRGGCPNCDESQHDPGSSGTSTFRTKGSHLEALAHVRRRHEPKHPLGARGASRQADRRVPRAGCPDRTVGPPDVRTGVRAGLGGRRARLPALLRPGLGVARCPRAHRTAHHRAPTRSRSAACM